MDIVCSLPSIDHMTGSKSTVMTSSINRQPIPVHKTTSESKGALPPLSVLLRPTPQHNLSEIQGENSNSVNGHNSPLISNNNNNNTLIIHDSVGHEEHKQQQHLSRTASPLFPAPHNHISGQLNSPDHHPHQNNVGHSSQRDMRLPSIKHFENITNIQHSSSSIKQHQAYPPCPPQPPPQTTTNIHLHSQQQPLIYNNNTSKQPTMSNGIRNSQVIPQQCNLECSNNCDLLSQSSPHLAHNSTVWTRPQTISHSPKQSQSPVTNNTSSQKPPIYGQNMDSKPVRFVTNNYPPDYQNNESFIKDNVGSSINTQNTDKMLSDMQKIADHCTIISQFATQYGDYRNQANKFGGGPFIPSPWISSPTGTPIVNLEQQVTEMISRTCEILNVLNCVKSEIGQTVSNDQDTINLIRTKRTTVGPSATRTKYRKRSKRAAPPGRCHSCNISETPEWRRGPDGARTLCNACGLHFAKLTRKRALSAMQQHQPTQVQVHKINQMAQMNRTTQVLPSIQPIGTQPKPTMGIMGNMGNMHLAPPLQTNQMMQSPPKRPRHDIPMNHHQMNGPINGNYLKA